MKIQIGLLIISCLCFGSGNARPSGNQQKQAATPKHGVQFTFKTDGPIRSTPLVNGDLLFFGSGDKKIYAINKSDGKKYWDFKTGGSVFSSPAISGDIVFLTSRDNYLYALKTTTGKLLWKFKFGELLGDKNYWDYYLGSPVADGETIYVGAGDGYLYAFVA